LNRPGNRTKIILPDCYDMKPSAASHQAPTTRGAIWATGCTISRHANVLHAYKQHAGSVGI